METPNNLAQVEIFGQSYNLRGDADSSYISELADYVDGKMREVSGTSPTVDSLKIAILAALNIADEHRRKRKEEEKKEEEANQSLGKILSILDHCLEM